MYPPIFEIVSNSAAVKSYLSDGAITRFYMFGQAPQDSVYPYAVWQIISGAPENYLGDVPNTDSYLIQIDVYAKKASDTRDIAMAIRDALERHAYITRWGGESIDNETQTRRISFDVSFYTHRAEQESL